MKRNEYLKISFQNKLHLEVEWWVRAISEFMDPPGAQIPTTPYTLVKEVWGVAVILPDGTREKIEDYQGKGPVFTIFDKVTVDPSWLPNISTQIETDLGILLANAILLAEVFGKKIPYMNHEVSIPDIEKIIAPKLTSNPPAGSNVDYSNPDVIYVKEMLDLGKGIEFIAAVMELFTIGLTRKTLLPPPGVDKYKEELLKDPNLDLNDPIQLAEFEKKLLNYDAQYLKDDPSYGKFASGKILKDSRKKLFLSMGAEGGFRKDGGITGVPRSLSEGLPRDPIQYVASINGSRSGSFSRGHETMEGGVAAKKMLAASINYVISKGDCGSTMGLERLYTPWLVNSLRGRTIISGKTQIKVGINEDVSKYLGKVVRTRSPMYCRRPGEEICAVCAGDSLARYETGISLPLTEISAAILAARMKAMHTNSLTVNDFDIKTLFS